MCYLFFVKNGTQDLLSTIVLISAFVIISLLDVLDGYLARKLGEVTNFGKIADPIADKLLIGGVLIIMNITAVLPVFVTILILQREAFITIFRIGYIKHKNIVIPASNLGKLKTFAQTSAIIGFLLPLPSLPTSLTIIAWVIMALAIALTYISAVQYVWQANRI